MPKERVCANGELMSRRTLLTTLPVSTALVSIPGFGKTDEVDPVAQAYQEWLAARREWTELAELPGNGNFDDPRTIAAENREWSAARQMLEATPTSLAGIVALTVLAWDAVDPGNTDPDAFAEAVKCNECQFVLAIWRACTGERGYPENRPGIG